MKHFIVGTAGHVDHGKTSLIQALTGIDTDRLPEEKTRGLSIDLGFAHMQLPPGLALGIVDVPGHERFLKNMLAGVGGFDLGLLIVDAQDGVMPQTREHLEILDLLGTPTGMVVLTKCDLVEGDFIDLVEDDVRQQLVGTFLENAPFVRVSSRTGQGLDELRGLLSSTLGPRLPRSSKGSLRLPVDRVFLRPGFGTVVTGSLWSGELQVGERVALLPAGEEYRIRGLQVHGQDVSTAVAGQRVAVNCTGIEPGSVRRGMLLATPGWLTPTQRVDVQMRLSQRLPHPLKHRARVRIYHGSSEVFARVLKLSEASPELVQLELDSPLLVLAGDTLIVRDATSSYTVGGALVLEALAEAHSKKDTDHIQRLLRQPSATIEERVLAQLDAKAPKHNTQLASQLQIPAQALSEALEQLRLDQRIVRLAKGWLRIEGVEEISDGLVGLLAKLQQGAPWKSGWRKDELLKILNESRPKLAEEVFQILLQQGVLESQGRLVCLPGHRAQLPATLQPAYTRLVKLLRDADFSPPDWKDGAGLLELNGPNWRILETYMLETEEAVRLTPEIVYLSETMAEGVRRLHELPVPFSAAQARDALGTSRKYAIPLLEHWDKLGVTVRQDEVRIMGGAAVAPVN